MKIKELRKKSNMSRRELARLVSTPVKKIKIWEEGGNLLPAGGAYMLAQPLGCATENLYGDSIPMKKVDLHVQGRGFFPMLRIGKKLFYREGEFFLLKRGKLISLENGEVLYLVS